MWVLSSKTDVYPSQSWIWELLGHRPVWCCGHVTQPRCGTPWLAPRAPPLGGSYESGSACAESRGCRCKPAQLLKQIRYVVKFFSSENHLSRVVQIFWILEMFVRVLLPYTVRQYLICDRTRALISVMMTPCGKQCFRCDRPERRPKVRLVMKEM